jgi:GNAT superfamily N-acetyltransferase
MTIHIRDAVPDDLGEVLDMMGEMARANRAVARLSPEALARQIADSRLGRVLVAAEAEGLIGYALILAWPDPHSGGTVHELTHLFVREWRRRSGIGRALIAAAQGAARAEGVETLILGVANDGFERVA